MQALAGIEVKTSALDGHILRLGADQVYLDARLALVEERPMDKARRVDVTVQLVAMRCSRLRLNAAVTWARSL